MNKIFAFLTVFLTFSALIAESFVPGTVNATRLNLRLSPSLKSAAVGSVAKDAKVQICGMYGSWLEIAAPESVKVYISEAYVRNGKTITEITMRSDRAPNAPILGKLPKGSAVKLLGERSFGWVRIAPPAFLKVYAASPYVDYDAAALRTFVQEKKAAAEKAAAEKAAAEKAAAEKAAAEKAAAEKAAAEKAAAEKAAAEKAAAEKAAAEKAAAEKAAAEVKTAEKKSVDKKGVPEIPAEPLMDLRAAALKELGVDINKKDEKVAMTGKLHRIVHGYNLATKYALLGSKGQNLAFICVEEEGMVLPFVDRQTVVTGHLYRVKGWKAPVILLDEIDAAK